MKISRKNLIHLANSIIVIASVLKIFSGRHRGSSFHDSLIYINRVLYGVGIGLFI